MHTKILAWNDGHPEFEFRIHHNADWSGDAIVTWDGGKAILPGWMAREMRKAGRRRVKERKAK